MFQGHHLSMKITLFPLLICMVVGCASKMQTDTSSEAIKESIPQKCSKADECAILIDACGETKAILKTEVKDDFKISKDKVTGQVIYSEPSGKYFCGYMNFAPPIEIKHPIASCKNDFCVVDVENKSIPKSNKR